MSRASRGMAAAAGLAAASLISVDLNELLAKNQESQQRHLDAVDQIVVKVNSEERDFTPDEEKAIQEAQANVVRLRKVADQYRAQIDLKTEAAKPGESRTRKDFNPGKPNQRETAEGGESEADAYTRAFDKWARFGIQELDSEERDIMQAHYRAMPQGGEYRDQSAIVGATGGFTVPQGFINAIEVAMKNFNGIRQSPTTKMPTSMGNDLPWPTVNDTSNEGELVSENTATNQGDVTSFGNVTFKAFLFSSKLMLIPIQLMQDTGVDIESLLTRLAGERLGRVTARYFTSGAGANQPQGLMTAIPQGKSAASSSAIAYTDLIDLQHSIDPAYRDNPAAAWMFHDTILGTIRKIVDGNGRPIWQPVYESGMANGAPGTLLGKPYFINQYMDNSVTSGKKTVVFGDLSKYVIRDVKDMTLVRLTERYAEKFQVGFFAFLRTDGRLLDAGTNPIKYLVH